VRICNAKAAFPDTSNAPSLRPRVPFSQRGNEATALGVQGLIDHAHPAATESLKDLLTANGTANEGLWLRHQAFILAFRQKPIHSRKRCRELPSGRAVSILRNVSLCRHDQVKGFNIGILYKRTNPAEKPIRNKILLAMTDVEFHVIRPHLEYVALPSHLRLHEAHQKFRFVYFPNEGLISLVVAMANGKTVEAGIVGRKGVAVSGRYKSYVVCSMWLTYERLSACTFIKSDFREKGFCSCSAFITKASLELCSR
jgi:hypothetical protein